MDVTGIRNHEESLVRALPPCSDARGIKSELYSKIFVVVVVKDHKLIRFSPQWKKINKKPLSAVKEPISKAKKFILF